MSTEEEKKRCGRVAVLGLPNAGKSTLVNTLVGTKVSIVSPKAQTTRLRVLGIALSGTAQIIMVDTPGIFSPRKTLEKAMVRAALDALEGSDALIHLIDASGRDPMTSNAQIIDKLPKKTPCFLVLNKIDQVKKSALLSLSETLNQRFSYAKTYMVSALKAQGIADLMRGLASVLPEGEWIYPADQAMDMPMRLMAAEITREKIFLQLYQELPHAAMVETESWEEFNNGSVKITQNVIVDRTSHKPIVLGRGGSRIKDIGTASRKDMEGAFGMRVHLKLFVKVQENWSEDAEHYRLMGLDFPG